MEAADPPSSLADWTPEQIAQGKLWVQAWKAAGPALERLRREELRACDSLRAIESLCFTSEGHGPPVSPPPTSGLIEQQRWFKKAAGRE